MSGRRREGLAPNLFPFLAVLICTLGTLILLLALVAQNAGEAIASQAAAPKSAEHDTEARKLAEADAAIERRLDEARWHRDQVVQMRDEQTQEIDERRIRQAHLEDHVQRLRDELHRLELEVAAAHDSPLEGTEARVEINAIKAKIADERVKIQKLTTEQQTATPRIVIVPHKGPNGTDRRPIYIECRADGVYLQPGDVAIDAKYLDNDVPGPNPLDAALRTIRTHSMKHYGDVDAPYPLIVVRPDGIETYAAARYAMKGWDDQYGYELVPQDVKLAYPAPDPLLNEQVELAIAKAVREQQLIARQGYGRGGRGGGAGLAWHGEGGPSEANPGDSSTRHNDLVATQPSGEPRANQGGAEASVPQPTPRRASDLPILSARNMDAAAQDALIHGYRNSGSGRVQSPNRRAATNDRLTNAPDSSSEPAAGADLALGSSIGSQTAQRSGANERNSSGKPTTDSPYTALNSLDASLGTQGEGADLGSRANIDPAAPTSDIASRSQQPSASSDPNAPIGGKLAMGSSDTTNPAGSAPPPLDAKASASNSQAGGSPPPAKVTLDANAQKPPKSLVKRSGQNWALPPATAATIGTAMVRTIRVECYDDRLVLLPEGGRGATNVYGFSDGNIDRASLEMATAIHDRVERWGAAMPGARWHPLLDAKVMPGGELRYQQLRRLMDGSGVEIQASGNTR